MYKVKAWRINQEELQNLDEEDPMRCKINILPTLEYANCMAEAEIEIGGFEEIEIYEYDPESKTESIYPIHRYCLTLDGWEID